MFDVFSNYILGYISYRFHIIGVIPETVIPQLFPDLRMELKQLLSGNSLQIFCNLGDGKCRRSGDKAVNMVAQSHFALHNRKTFVFGCLIQDLLEVLFHLRGKNSPSVLDRPYGN